MWATLHWHIKRPRFQKCDGTRQSIWKLVPLHQPFTSVMVIHPGPFLPKPRSRGGMKHSEARMLLGGKERLGDSGTEKTAPLNGFTTAAVCGDEVQCVALLSCTVLCDNPPRKTLIIHSSICWKWALLSRKYISDAMCINNRQHLLLNCYKPIRLSGEKVKPNIPFVQERNTNLWV